MNPLQELKKTLLKLTVEDLARRIDHALLKPWASRNDLEKALEELEKHKLRCLITTPQAAHELVQKTSSCIGAVVGFPFGYSTIESKIKELEDVIGYGVKEVDVVVNHHLYSLGRREEFEAEAKALVTICREAGVTCKVIIEATAYDEKTVREMVTIVATHNPDYIKTSTGYGPRPTYPEDVVIIRDQLARLRRSDIGVKAAGGIRTALQALSMIMAGADIIGTSTPTQVLKDYERLRGMLA